MARATFACQLALGQHWNAASYTWTDVSKYLRSFQGQRGRTYELDTFEPGSFQFTFRNNDGKFTPAAGGTYTQPWTPIRFGFTYAGLFYERFRGYIERSELMRDPQAGAMGGASPRSYGSKYSETTVTATDGLGVLAQHFFPMHDDNAGYGSGRVKLGTWTERSTPFSAGSSMGTNKAIRVYAEISRTARSSGKIYILKRTEFDLRYTDQNGNTGQKGTLELQNTERTTRHRHHHRHRRKNHHHHWPPKSSGHVEPGHIFEVSLHQGDLLSSVQSMVFKAGEYSTSILLTLWGERAILNQGLSSAQIVTLLDDLGWPAGLRTIATGTHTLIPQSPWGSSMLEVGQEIMDSELGAFYCNRTGKLVFEGRKTRYNAWPANPTLFGDQPGIPSNPTTELPYAAAVGSRDLDDNYNDVRITRVGIGDEQPAPQRRQSSTWQSVYGWRTFDRDTLVTTDAQAGKQADWILQTHTASRYRVGSVTVMPYRDDARLFPAVGKLDISSSVRMRERNAGTGLIQNDYWVEAVSESGSAATGWADYTVELTLSPRITVAPY